MTHIFTANNATFMVNLVAEESIRQAVYIIIQDMVYDKIIEPDRHITRIAMGITNQLKEPHETIK